MSVSGTSGTTSVNMQNIQSMDIETALMMVQSERTKLLDAQLQTQIQEVQNRNEQVAKLNNVLGELNDMMSFYGSDATKTFSQDGASRAFTDNGASYDKFVMGYQAPLNRAIKDAGITDLGFPVETTTWTLDDKGNKMSAPSSSGSWGGNTTKAQMETAITKVKGMIDAAGNSQQMDMLRLQSMSNKRNEAFDVMTNFVKKMQESRSSIIGNMR